MATRLDAYRRGKVEGTRRSPGAGPSRSDIGETGETRALRHLERQGLTLVTRNYRVAAGPGAHAGEVDLVMRDRDGTLVFVEVRARASRRHGGAAASVGIGKQRKVIYAARHYLSKLRTWPPCRFDVIALDAEDVTWIKAAFDSST